MLTSAPRASDLSIVRVLALCRNVNDRERIDLDQIVGIGQRRYPHQYVGWFVISEQRCPRLLDSRQAFTLVIDDVDCDLDDLPRLCTGSGKCTALARNEHPLASRRDDNLGVRLPEHHTHLACEPADQRSNLVPGFANYD